MIVGYFAPDGSPRIRARVNLAGLGVVGDVHFLVDTGTDTTILHPTDADDLHCPFDELSNPVVATSAGGQHTYYAEPAVSRFTTAKLGTTFVPTSKSASPIPSPKAWIRCWAGMYSTSWRWSTRPAVCGYVSTWTRMSSRYCAKSRNAPT